MIHQGKPTRLGSKNRYKNCLTLKDMYKVYLRGVDPGSKFDIGWKRYKELSYALMNEAMRYILEDAGTLKLYYNLGAIRIRKIKTQHRHLKCDFRKTMELGIKVYFLNLHTKGYHVRFVWHRKGLVKVTGIKPYSFIPHRNRRKELSFRFQNGQDYLE